MKLETEQWQRLKSVLADALNEHTAETRLAFLRRSCADDTTLLLEASALLNEAEAMLRGPQDGFEACANMAVESLRRRDSGRAGKRVGAYVLSEEIGRGGMGAVYLAERADGEFQKKVAIKLLKRGTDTDDVLRRFRAEQQILANLEHPNIARLLDAGTTDDGLPYFVMEYVDGVPATRYVRAKEASIEERLRLFLRICAAVEAAHEQRIVHRDLKPSNILVTRSGEPKLLDFGIAKIVAPERSGNATATVHQILTPAAASPEQVRGDAITVASDVYALGALLYEMLTGNPPHRFERLPPSREDLVRIICEEEVPPLSSAADSRERRFMHRDLNRVVMHALRKEPAQRYRSVAAFAGDIARYLDGHPVTARRITLLYRAERLFKRNRPVFIGALSGVVALLVALSLIRYLHPGAADNLTSDNRIASDSVLILPFDEVGNGSEDGYIGAGIQQEIQNDLRRLRELRVVSRAPAPRDKAPPSDPLTTARSLGVKHVLRGKVETTADRVHVAAQLLDTESGATIWSEEYDNARGDLLKLQREMARRIVAELRLKISSSESAAIKRNPTEDLEAYDLYLRARAAMRQFGVEESRENFQKAVALLEAAVAHDPKFAGAYAQLAFAQLSLYRFPYDQEPRRLRLAQDAAQTAMSLAPDSAESHLAWARYLSLGLHDYAAARDALKKMPSPRNGDSLALSGVIERRLGNWSKAIADARAAVDLQPADPLAARILSHTYLAYRRYDEAVEACDRAISLMTSEEAAAIWEIRVSAEQERGEIEKARDLLQDAPRITMKTYRAALLAAYAGKNDQANLLAEDVSNDPLEQRMALFLRGVLARQAGETQTSRRLLRQARAFLEPLVHDPVDPEALGQLGVVDALLDDQPSALDEVDRAAELLPLEKDAVAGAAVERSRILAEAWSGKTDLAINRLQLLVQLPYGPSAGELRFDPLWEPLRHDSRFPEIVERASRPILPAEPAAKQ